MFCDDDVMSLYLGTDAKSVYDCVQRLRQLSFRIDLTKHRHTFALEKIRNEVLSLQNAEV